MDGTLQDRALLAATQNISSLKGLFAFCANNPKITDSCEKSAFFWRESLMRLFGKTMVLQRGDLTDEDWPTFAKILVTGRIFEYAMRLDVFDLSYTGPDPYYSMVEDKKLANEDIYYEAFRIPVAVPLAGTRGYYVRWDFDGSHFFELTSFFVGPDQDRTLRLASEWIAVEYHKYHMENLNIARRFNGKVDFFTDATYREPRQERNPMPDPTSLTQLVLNEPLAPNGYKTDLWFCYYGPYDSNNRAKNTYSESNYKIVPIVF